MARVDELPVRERAALGGEDEVRRRGLLLILSTVAGFLLTVIWSAEFVDKTVGGNIAGSILGHDPETSSLASVAAGTAFAFTSGLAGTFTACNIAVFGTVAPMLGTMNSRTGRAVQALKPLGWLFLGMAVVSAVYGAVVGLVGTSMPQFSEAQAAPGVLSGRSLQSMITFGVIGLAMLYLGLSSLGYVRDPFAKAARRFPHAQTVFMGVLVGGFLVGRPYPLFRQLFRDAAESGNPFYGAAVFVLQSVGNVVIIAVLFFLMAYFAGGRLAAWMIAKPGRMAAVTAVTLIVAGVFTFLYWDVRMLARREIIPWYPIAPWAA
ncbi:hypothetical protein PUR28_01015 [Streptomyces sp. BE308]|uniref:hypothetical protein n=1 Tax=unclassified Streptomyces TaxID=2593676 RepID=UPI002DD7FFC8|nr:MULTISPECIES: hypothetical protein [unclassified Streptomyces]MEE1789375.1 hypothetical protein [Streptomyces sp. BE308]WRZ78671.1 hypothetical protein OG251_44500 [Streptomyces sp. NBC_01237]